MSDRANAAIPGLKEAAGQPPHPSFLVLTSAASVAGFLAFRRRGEDQMAKGRAYADGAPQYQCVRCVPTR